MVILCFTNRNLTENNDFTLLAPDAEADHPEFSTTSLVSRSKAKEMARLCQLQIPAIIAKSITLTSTYEEVSNHFSSRFARDLP